jgi:hypothetical protein
MSDVLFDTGKFTLRPLAVRDYLAKQNIPMASMTRRDLGRANPLQPTTMRKDDNRIAASNRSSRAT